MKSKHKMKSYYSKLVFIVFLSAAILACSDKKYENNIKSLEKRIAELETKSGVVAEETETVAAGQEGSETEFPIMTFEQTEFDFGSVKAGVIVDYTYKFKNTGNAMLIISKATATCGCTVPEWPKEPIKPGDSGEIRVKFDSKNRKDLQTKYVNINANTKPEVTRLKLSGSVIPGEDSNN